MKKKKKIINNKKKKILLFFVFVEYKNKKNDKETNRNLK